MAGRWGRDDNSFEEGEGDVNPFSVGTQSNSLWLLALIGLRVQYVAFASLLGLIICLLWNLICVTAAWISGASAYYLWYRPLYRAMRKESAFSYGWFFMFYFFHIAFCIYAAAAPSFFWSRRSLTGIFQAIYEISDDNAAIGIMYFVGFALFVLEALLSIWVMQKV